MSKGHTKMAKAAASLMKGHKRGMKRYRQVPKELIKEPSLQFALAVYWRKRKKYAQARKTLLKVQDAHKELPEPLAWWGQRLDMARQGLARNNKEAWPLAYRLASRHGFTEGWKFVQGEFLSGWIALQFLKEPKKALGHFQTLRDGDERRSIFRRPNTGSAAPIRRLAKRIKRRSTSRPAPPTGPRSTASLHAARWDGAVSTSCPNWNSPCGTM